MLDVCDLCMIDTRGYTMDHVTAGVRDWLLPRLPLQILTLVYTQQFSPFTWRKKRGMLQDE